MVGIKGRLWPLTMTSKSPLRDLPHTCCTVQSPDQWTFWFTHMIFHSPNHHLYNGPLSVHTSAVWTIPDSKLAGPWFSAFDHWQCGQSCFAGLVGLEKIRFSPSSVRVTVRYRPLQNYTIETPGLHSQLQILILQIPTVGLVPDDLASKCHVEPQEGLRVTVWSCRL